MKKFLLLSLLLLSFQMYGQHHNTSAHFGVKVGVNYPSYYGRDYNADKASLNIKNQRGFTAGIYVNSELSDYFWLKHEFMFVNKNYTYDETVPGLVPGLSSTTTFRDLNVSQYYIDAYPLNAAAHFKGLQLLGGPAVSFLLAQNKEVVNSNGEIETSTEISDRNIFEIGYVLGFEYEIFFGLNVGARFVKQYTSIFQSSQGKRKDYFSQNWLFTLGYSIGKKHHKRKHDD